LIAPSHLPPRPGHSKSYVHFAPGNSNSAPYRHFSLAA
jgi:hypothetical protein